MPEWPGLMGLKPHRVNSLKSFFKKREKKGLTKGE